MRLQPTLLIALATLSLVGPANASAYDSWEGFYGGLSIGQRTLIADWAQTGLYDTEGPYLMDSHFTRSSRDRAAYAGVYAGYNWLISSQVIAGVELSAGYAGNESSANPLYLPPTPVFDGVLPTAAATTLKSDWDAKLRGRLGYMVTPTTLLYGAAGVAVTQLKATTTCRGPIGFVCFGPDRKETVSETLFGWTAGVGVEHALSDRVLARAEYSYTDYERASFMAQRSGKDDYDFASGSGSAAAGIRGRADLTTQAFSLGLTYRF
ncbi:outer membrane protein [Pseudomonas sp. PA27(2017)]|uniref:outer membrane protein n=1 Tax=Pseudomonas sp. PA27(2017) TaxID=1932112 RepID=UPI00095AC143|nr:outer membrane beta-barrel protein [Pseudomonas sp. PA27(2017)]OLU36027.1 hypothetical protein BVH06_00875 [Pseudomonas sp. PA27(2017)]